MLLRMLSLFREKIGEDSKRFAQCADSPAL